MSMRFSVRVVSSAGEPRRGVRVAAGFGLMHGTTTSSTNSDGWAELRAKGDYSSAEIFVDGSSVGDHAISDGETLAFTLG